MNMDTKALFVWSSASENDLFDTNVQNIYCKNNVT